MFARNDPNGSMRWLLLVLGIWWLVTAPFISQGWWLLGHAALILFVLREAFLSFRRHKRAQDDADSDVPTVIE